MVRLYITSHLVSDNTLLYFHKYTVNNLINRVANGIKNFDLIDKVASKIR